MDEFSAAIKDVEKKCSELLQSASCKFAALPKVMPTAGVYIYSENGKMLYVGRTSNLRRRLQYHTRNNHNQATFAFLLARHRTGKMKASYQTVGSRSDLLSNGDFRAAFDNARAAIREMDIQFIEETDPTKQALLEICTAMKSGAKYNDFDNH